MSPAFNTAEFRRSDGPLEHNAATAWNLGHTGQGVTIAIVDTGIDEDSPEFAGRLSPLSRDIVADRSLSGPDDHGTNVAMIAAAARDNTGIMGIAYQSTIMALRTDAVGSCGGDNPQDPETDCNFPDSAIAASINYASSNGAKVINISLGGEGASTAVRNAVATAVSRGALIVVAAGNDGEAEPDSFARILDQAGNGGVIIVGSVDEDGAISSFSNRAGTQNTHFMTARGSRLCCAYQNGQIYVDDEGFIYLLQGTSYSAPQVSGAAALLAQAFPNLTGRQIADILLRSAFDAGALGTDVVFGRGILDIARAFAPIGAT
ncbi:MAG TPA: S8 family peptidase, partial [Croceibacterium sp.]|nr:S8 family peptidase [Croceibacterium sp.]